MFEGLKKFQMEGSGGDEDRKFLKGEANSDGEDGGEEGRNVLASGLGGLRRQQIFRHIAAKRGQFWRRPEDSGT